MIKFLLGIPPTIGSKWALRGNNPFESWFVTIKSVKRGWVKYDYSTGGSSSQEVRSFRLTYEEMNHEQP